MGENINVKRTGEELDQKQDEYIGLESELKKYQEILAQKRAQLLEHENGQEPEQ